MNKNTFNPDQWLTSPADHKHATAQTDKTAQPAQTSTLDDIEAITQRIESSRADIAPDYTSWRDLGFALAHELGETGRDYYHRLSRFYPNYSPQETDKQYDKCLRSHGTGITIKTFFQLAKDNGINIATKTKYAECANYAVYAKPKTAQTPSPEEEIQLPTFSPTVTGRLPDFLEKIRAQANSEEDADILILGAMTVISACLPHISGVYAGRTIYPNLFLFVTARASSGKGRLALCRYLVEPIHDHLRETNEAEIEDYKHRLAEYNAAGKKKVNMDKPEEPPMRMLFIPANSSATAVYQVLNDNGGQGLMFETEGDTLANTFGSDYGNYSDGFRKAFHHESISYIRRKDREYVNIKHPRLSTLLTGTPRQILNLITDAENGLFSRFIFYHLNLKLVWNNVFQTQTDITLDEYFQSLGKDYHNFHTILKENKDLRFTLTRAQQNDFNTRFEAHQQHYSRLHGDEFVASIRRLGLITFRLAMILTGLRIMETGDFDSNLICADEDYRCAIAISEVLLKHNSHVFSTLPKPTTSTTSATVKSTLKQQFLDALPEEFDRKTYQELATALGLNPRTTDRHISNWLQEGKLERLAQGQYRKT